MALVRSRSAFLGMGECYHGLMGECRLPLPLADVGLGGRAQYAFPIRNGDNRVRFYDLRIVVDKSVFSLLIRENCHLEE